MKPEMETIKQYFIDPTDVDNNGDIAQLAYLAANFLSEIYTSRGSISAMDPELKKWLLEVLRNNDPTVETALAKVLNSEINTRRFDEKFMGQIHPHGSKIGILSNLIGSFMNNNTIVHEVSMSESRMEQEALDRIASWFGYQPECYSGNMVTGGTTANLEALTVAREKVLTQLHPSQRRKANLYVIYNNMKHYSISKACRILGMNSLEIPTIGYKMDVAKAEAIVEAFSRNSKRSDGSDNIIAAMVGIAGETETGMVEDLQRLAELAADYGIHFHVDAAYGGPFILSQSRGLFQGIENADSITIDPHKMLYTPYSAGAILFKNGEDLRYIQKLSKARYLDIENDKEKKAAAEQKADQVRSFGGTRLEGSMGSGGVIATWATLQLLGEEGLETLLDHTIELTQYLYDRVSQSEVLVPLNEPETNTLLVGTVYSAEAHTPKEYKEKLETIQKRIDKMGYYFSTNDKLDQGLCCFRFVVMNPYTTKDNLDEAIDLLEQEVFETFG